MMNNIKRIEEISDLEELGVDLVRFYIYFEREDGSETTMPYMISWWNLLKFIRKTDESAALYIAEVSSKIRHYGPAETKILQILNAEEFNTQYYIEQYLKNLPEGKIAEHIEWSENIKQEVTFNEKVNELQSLIPDLAQGNSRISLFTDALDAAVQKEVTKYYPEFFANPSDESYKNFDNILMENISNMVTKLNNFFFQESQK